MKTNRTASKPNIVYVENVVTIVTNITKQVRISPPNRPLFISSTTLIDDLS
jgi:hypothetical protein